MPKLKMQSGFSIIELIVVVFIIGIMSSVMFANYRQGERDTTLEYAAQGIAQDIRKAQNLSLAGSKLDEEFTWGYGIHFDINKKSEYFIYGDVGVQNIDYQYDKVNDKVVPDLITLPTNVEISDITITSNKSDVADIFFVPPDPITCVNGCAKIKPNEPEIKSNYEKAEIKICFTTTAKCKKITTTMAGRVEVE